MFASLCVVAGLGCFSQKNGMEDPVNDADTRAAAPAAASEVVRDAAYGTDSSQRCDVYLPKQRGKAPVLFFVHGGAWMKGDKANAAVVTNKIGHWVAKGYIVVSANYRLSPPDPLQQADDVAKALAFAQSKASTWGGDPDRFVLVGHSSGAHLVSLLASDPSIAEKHDARPWLGAVALDSAAFDVERIMNAQHFPFYDRVFGNDPEYWREASPLHRLSAAPKPMFLVCSSERRISCAQAEAFAAKVKGLGGQAQVFPVALTHQEINEQLGTAGQYTNAVDSFLQSLGLP